MLVRELRATTDGPLLIARFGSCGGVGQKAEVGSVVVAREGAVMVQRNWDFFAPHYGNKVGLAEDEAHAEKAAWETNDAPYRISKICPADRDLSEALLERLRYHLGETRVHSGLNATADSFYSSQGRTDPAFHDANRTLLARLPIMVPQIESLEMETYALLHMAACARHPNSIPSVTGQAPVTNDGEGVLRVRSIRASACAMVFADRKGNAFIDPLDVVRLERSAGRAVLEAVTSCPL
ncbi:hypothetical protein HDV00_005768 [Rhizophlyctis rosea]|nr:hypothetical protein HDV00_005768 [Rhizophlyctis rosea]